MNKSSGASLRGFTLIELLSALFILSLLALMSYRGLNAVLDAREHVSRETLKWQQVASFFARFSNDIGLSAPRPVRTTMGAAPAWQGLAESANRPRLEFSRFAAKEGLDTPRRISYQLNDQQEIELWLWPALDVTSDILPVHYPVLANVMLFELQYLNADLSWVDAWPRSPGDAAIPRAVKLRIVLASGEALVRVFALRS